MAQRRSLSIRANGGAEHVAAYSTDAGLASKSVGGLANLAIVVDVDILHVSGFVMMVTTTEAMLRPTQDQVFRILPVVTEAAGQVYRLYHRRSTVSRGRCYPRER